MKNIIHTLTRAQMRANPRRTLVTLIGVILSVTMLTAVFAGADSFLNLLYRQAAEDNGTWHGRAFETGEQVVQNLSQDDRVDQLGLAAGWGMVPLDDQNRWGAALYGVNQSFYQLLGVECLEGTLPAKENELAITRTIAEKTGWKLGEQVSLDLLRVWTPQGMDSTGATTYRQTSGLGIMGLSDSYVIHSVGENQFTITAIVDPGGFDDQNVLTWEPCFTALEEQIPPDGLWCAYYTVNPLGQELYNLMEDIQNWQAALPADAGGVGTIDLNRQLLLYYGMDYPGSLLLPAFYGLMAVTLLIILVGAVSLARNAFAISMSAHPNAGNAGQCRGDPGAEAAIRPVRSLHPGIDWNPVWAGCWLRRNGGGPDSLESTGTGAVSIYPAPLSFGPAHVPGCCGSVGSLDPGVQRIATRLEGQQGHAHGCHPGRRTDSTAFQ